MRALVLAGGFPQIALLQELRRRGIFTVLADYNTEPVAKPFADIFYQVSTLDVPAITEVAKKEAVDFLITACTDQALLTVAQVSEELGLPCYLDFETARNVTNKSYMKRVFKASGIPTANYAVLSKLSMEATSGFRYPLVVKPVDSNSSKGVKKVSDQEELEAAFEQAVGLSRTGEAIVEEFVEGQEISIDAVVLDGKAHILATSYSDKIPERDGFVIYRARYPVTEPAEIHRQIREVAQQIADAFGLKNAPMLIQAISCKGRLYVLEFSARTGGGIKYCLIKTVSGVDVIKAVVDMTLGAEVRLDLRGPEAAYISNVFLYCAPGVFDRLDGFEELEREGALAGHYLFKSRGAGMRAPENSGDRIAAFTVQAGSAEELRERYGKVLSRIRVFDRDGRDILRHDLLYELNHDNM